MDPNLYELFCDGNIHSGVFTVADKMETKPGNKLSINRPYGVANGMMSGFTDNSLNLSNFVNVKVDGVKYTFLDRNDLTTGREVEINLTPNTCTIDEDDYLVFYVGNNDLKDSYHVEVSLGNNKIQCNGICFDGENYPYYILNNIEIDSTQVSIYDRDGDPSSIKSITNARILSIDGFYSPSNDNIEENIIKLPNTLEYLSEGDNISNVIYLTDSELPIKL